MSLIPNALPGGEKALSCSMSGFADPQAALQQIADYFRQIADTDPQFAAVSGSGRPAASRSTAPRAQDWRG